MPPSHFYGLSKGQQVCSQSLHTEEYQCCLLQLFKVYTEKRQSRDRDQLLLPASWAGNHGGHAQTRKGLKTLRSFQSKCLMLPQPKGNSPFGMFLPSLPFLPCSAFPLLLAHLSFYFQCFQWNYESGHAVRCKLPQLWKAPCNPPKCDDTFSKSPDISYNMFLDCFLFVIS